MQHPDYKTIRFWLDNFVELVHASQFPPAKQKEATAVLDLARQALLERAKLDLVSLMSDLSEEYWCAGWLMELEYLLWNQLHSGSGFRPGNFADVLLRLHQLSQQVGGWYHWPRDDSNFPIGDGPVFIGLDEWNLLYKAWKEPNGKSRSLLSS